MSNNSTTDPRLTSPSPALPDIPPLNALLNRAEQAELALLISSICERMRANFSVTLDSMTKESTPARTRTQAGAAESPSQQSRAPSAAGSTPPVEGQEEEKLSPHEGKSDRWINTESLVGQEQKRRTSMIAQKQYRERKQQKFCQSALANFDRWAEQVQARLFGVINSRDGVDAAGWSERGTSEANSGVFEFSSGTPDSPNRNCHDQIDLKVLQSVYPPVEPPTPLLQLPFNAREKVLYSLLLLVLSLEHYDARSRVLLHFLCSSLDLPYSVLLKQESATAEGLISAVSISADAESQKRIEETKTAKRWKVGLASVAGAAVIGLTGGLAAPLVAAGIGGLLGCVGLGATVAAGYLGAVAGSGAIVGALFGAYGGKMTGEMVERYASEVEDFAFIPLPREPEQGHQRPRKPPATTFDQITPIANAEPDKKLVVTVGISGWLTKPEDVTLPWRCLSPKMSSLYALRFDPEALLDIGTSLSTLLESYGWSFIQYEILKHTVIATLYLALWPLALVKAARVIDNPYSVARHRAEKAGRVLADVLCNRVQGERPVNLIGFGLGARVVYYCMHALAHRGAFGVVQDVYLLGAPVASENRREWAYIRAAAAGRVVNGYSGSDWVLGFLERGTTLSMGIAGLQAVENVAGVENVDLGKGKQGERLVEGHMRYLEVTGLVLKECGLGAFGGLEEGELRAEGAVLQKLWEQNRIEMELAEKANLEQEKEKELREKEEEKKSKVKQELQQKGIDEVYRVMREAMQPETAPRAAVGQLEACSVQPALLPPQNSEVQPLLGKDHEMVSPTPNNLVGNSVGGWVLGEEGIDDVVERVERGLMERSRKRGHEG